MKLHQEAEQLQMLDAAKFSRTTGLGGSSCSDAGVLYTKINGVLETFPELTFKVASQSCAGNRPQTFGKSLQLWFSRNSFQHWGLPNEHQNNSGILTGSSPPQKKELWTLNVLTCFNIFWLVLGSPAKMLTSSGYVYTYIYIYNWRFRVKLRPTWADWRAIVRGPLSWPCALWI